MTNERAVAALRRNRQSDSKRKRAAVLQALLDAQDAHATINVSAIATRAHVSRPFVYSHPDLRAAIEAAARADDSVPKKIATTQDVDRGLRATIKTLVATVERQKKTIVDLQAVAADHKQQRARWLGKQLEQQTAVDPEEHAELRLTCDRLLAGNASLERTTKELRRLNAVLESDLAASRQAHAEDLARLGSGHGVPVTPLRTRKPAKGDRSRTNQDA